MSQSEPQTSPPVPPERLAEASVWIARLHGDARGRALENGLRRWLLEDPDNARAFELATEVWDDAAHLRRFISFHPGEHERSGVRWRPVLAIAASCAMLIIIAGVVWLQYQAVIATAVGEQRHVVLEDGTRVFLNTDTRIVVKYEERVRRVELHGGEALFNVAKRTDRPFIVVAGDRQVRALGTSFVVRKDAQQLAVTLVAGSVLVTRATAAGRSAASDPDAAPGAVAQMPSATTSDQGERGEFKLTPGQRLTISNDAPFKLDMPSVERTTAWRRGQVILDDTWYKLRISLLHYLHFVLMELEQMLRSWQQRGITGGARFEENELTAMFSRYMPALIHELFAIRVPVDYDIHLHLNRFVRQLLNVRKELIGGRVAVFIPSWD